MSEPYEKLEQRIREIRREIENQEKLLYRLNLVVDGNPDVDLKGLRERVIDMEAAVEALVEAREQDQVEKRVERVYRKGIIAGLSMVGVLSGGSLYGVIRVLQTLLGSAP